MKFRPIILCGGLGSRLWPLSSKEKPKQFIKFLGSKRSLLQITVDRFLNKNNFNEPIFVTNIAYVEIVEEQLSEMGINNPIIIIEPEGKNTAPSIAVASYYMQEYYPEELMLVVPSDAYIENFSIFLNHILSVFPTIKEQNKFILLGIKPAYPETGFGYIKPLDNTKDLTNVEIFTEKPTKEKAMQYLEEGYLWNAGIFIFKPELYLQELLVFEPNISTNCKEAYKLSTYNGNKIFINKEFFSKSNSNSIDYAVIEKTTFAQVLSINNVKWCDIGSWKAVYQLSSKDEQGNVFVGQVKAINCYNCYVYSPNVVTAICDLENKIIINTNDISLTISLKNDQKVKDLYNLLFN